MVTLLRRMRELLHCHRQFRSLAARQHEHGDDVRATLRP